MVLFFYINYVVSDEKVFVISGITKQIYDKYKIFRILWYCGCSPKEVKKLISEYGSLHDIKNNIIDRFKTAKKPCKYFYKLYLVTKIKLLLGHKKNGPRN